MFVHGTEDLVQGSGGTGTHRGLHARPGQGRSGQGGDGYHHGWIWHSGDFPKLNNYFALVYMP